MLRNVSVQVLKQVSLLNGLDEPALANLLSSGERLVRSANEFVIRQGEFGDSLFVILNGRIKIRAFQDDGLMKTIVELGPGDYFGEMAMLGLGERTASAVTSTNSELLEIRQVPFNKATKKFKQVKKRLEDVFQRRTTESFVRSCYYFRDLSEQLVEQLVSLSQVKSFKKNDLIVREGEEANRLFVIVHGFVRVSRTIEGQQKDEILAYLSDSDFFGDQELSAAIPDYTTSVVAVEPVQAIVIPRTTFWRINEAYPEIFSEFRRYEISRRAKQLTISKSVTSMAFVKDVLESGLGQARSALIINMDSCVRCGNCVQACDDLHGYSRLARRGKKLTRRIDIEKTAHESLYFPTSCMQCATPECMVSCPTGAISRDIGGEVFVRDSCIGCGSCARNCDFGNISTAKAKSATDFSLLDMVTGKKPPAARPQEEAPKKGKKGSDLVAVKCDVCFDRNHAACVYNCPTEAIMRIDPRAYFDELAQIAPRASYADIDTGAKTTNRRPNRWTAGVLQILTTLASIFVGYAVWLEYKPSSWAGLGWYSGILSAILMVALGFIGARKRARTAKLGSLSAWVKAHSIMGGLFYGLVLFHAGYQASSTLTALLLSAVTLVCLLGGLGQIANFIIPRLLVRTEDAATLPEDVAPEMKRLYAANQELLDPFDPKTQKQIRKIVSKVSGSGFTAFTKGYSPKKLEVIIYERSQNLPNLDEAVRATALRIAQNQYKYNLWRVRKSFETLMSAWVPMHLVTSCLAFLFLIGHVLTVALW